MLHIEKLNSIAPARIRLFGAVQIQSERLITSHFRTGRVAALLAYLALHPLGEVSREELADQLWPNLDGPTGRNNLRLTLQYLKRALEEHGLSDIGLRVDRNWIALNQDSIVSDARVFRSRCAAAHRETNHDAKLFLLRQALEEARGPLAPELYDPWLEAIRDEIRRERFAAAAELSDELLDAAPGEALIYAREACAEQPLSDHARQIVATAYLRLGQPASALLELRDHEHLCRRELGIGLSPTLSRLLAEIEAPVRSIPRRRSVARPATRHYGRESELRAVQAWLRAPHARLLTLYGPGGIGKTRLATEIATDAEQTMKCVWVDLAHVERGDALLEAVCFAASPTAVAGRDCLIQIEEALGREPCVVILDNLEQIPDTEMVAVSHLCQAAPDAKILATSRKTLGLAGETLLRLEPLPLPNPESSGASPALEMFLDRARACRAGAPLNEEETELAAKLAQRLEGIPLAIELAAARMTALGVRDLLDGMEQPLDLLISTKRAEARQSGLGATLDWSFAQVPEQFRPAILGLATIAGSWPLDAAWAVCCAERSQGWAGLMVQTACEHSLAYPLGGTSPTRFRMLEMTREYALSCLEPQDRQRMAEAHASYYLELATRRIGDPALLDELPNLEVALAFFARSPQNFAGLIALAEALNWLWWETGAGRTALRTLQEFSERPLEPGLRARLLVVISQLLFATSSYPQALASAYEGAALAADDAVTQGRLLGLVARGLTVTGKVADAKLAALTGLVKVGDHPVARAEVLQSFARVLNAEQDPAVLEVAAEAVALARNSGNPALLVDILDTAISVNLGQHRFAQAEELLTEAKSLQKHHVPNGLNSARLFLRQAALAGKLGRPAEARDLYKEAAEIGRQSHNHWVITQSLTQIGDFSQFLGDLDEALACHLEALAMRRSSSDALGEVTNLLGAGRAMQALGRSREAYAMLSEALAISDELAQPYHQATCLVPCAEVAAELGHLSTAGELARRAEKLWTQIRDVDRNPDAETVDRHLERIKDVRSAARGHNPEPTSSPSGRTRKQRPS